MKIKSVTKSAQLKPTWDIEVHNTHTYQLANRVLSHNTIANILGTTQCTELPWEEIFTKKNLSGTFKYIAHTLLNNPHGLPFKSARSVDQLWTVWSAAARQIWIDQAQSTNYFVNPSIPDHEIGDSISNMYKEAWLCGCKTSYYLYGQAEENEVKITDNTRIDQASELATGAVCAFGEGGPDCEACS
jgi:ribonucleotide reductase alpha subunit